jgi:hypothetical protein
MTPERIEKRMQEAAYVGDGLYALWDGQDIALFAHDGIRIADIVYLEPEVQVAFARFMEGIVSGETKPVKFE